MTDTRKMHVALNTNKFDESVEFYRGFFGGEPVKLEAGYAKFELENPALNFTLNRSASLPQNPGSLNHLGIQVDSSDAVAKAAQRFVESGYETLNEDDTVCCYALQDKVWVTDPNGYRWEVFVVKDGYVVDESDPAVQAAAKAKDEACCEPSCCN